MHFLWEKLGSPLLKREEQYEYMLMNENKIFLLQVQEKTVILSNPHR